MPDDMDAQEEAVERETIVREFPVEFSEGDGRTLEARIVPFNTPTVVRDNGGEPYTETWLPGAFENQTRAANRVLLNFEHEPGLGGVVGHGTDLVERDDALYGTFRVLDGPDGDKTLQLVNEGMLTGISLEAVALRSVKRGSIVQRVRAHLDKVSLCRFPAFKEAQVLAVREGEPEPEEPEPAPEPEPVPAVAERSQVDEVLERVGYAPLLTRVIVRTPWDGSAARFEDEEWRRSCILDRGADFETAKQRYGYPVLEPSGDLNINGMHAAAARLNQASASPAQKAAAARKLIRYYNQAGEKPPPSLRALAGR